MTAYVGVVGPGESTDDVLALATEVGRLLAESGAVLVTGGGAGVMAAAAAGAGSAGGVSVALLPGDDRTAVGHPHTVTLPTGLGEMRNALLVRSVDAVVCVGGSWGTLSEVALARRTGRPVVVLRGWRVQDVDGVEPALVHAESAEDAVRLVMRALDQRP